MKKGGKISRAETAQLAMMLEVCTGVKPGNVDRFHDYDDTWLEHFLASAILAKPAFEEAEGFQSSGKGIGDIIYDAVALTNTHSGGNTHFGAFILLIPLIAGGSIDSASGIVRSTTVADAVSFYKAFSLTSVRMNETDELDVNDPAALDHITEKGMTLYDVMDHSSQKDMVAAEWTNGFRLTENTAEFLINSGSGKKAISDAFISLLSEETDTFIVKKFGEETGVWAREKACLVREGRLSIEDFDEMCLERGVNPGSVADIIIAGIYIAISRGWGWDS
ncbi:MAG: triphosphoribosyl-dephospho-CoA synthase [Methanomicrobiaceae archaeon]|nr:triphosphoribosyl-dephospho-CoA synthase [Methanomicrobiaceae archaeon]